LCFVGFYRILLLVIYRVFR